MRNKVLAAATLLIISLMFFVFHMILALSLATDSVIERVEEKIDISVEVLPGVERYSIEAFMEGLRRRPEIRDVALIGKDEALKKFGSKYPNVIGFLQSHQLQNPLPDVVRIVTSDLSENSGVIALLEGPDYAWIVNQEKLQSDQEQKTRNEKILDITQFLHRVGWGLSLLVALVAVLIIFNSISLNIHAHQHEIKVMQLVGAKYGFIRGGFIVEGVLYAVMALVVSVAFSQGVLSYLAKNLLAVIQNESVLAGLNAVLFYFDDRLSVTLLLQLGVALLAGIGSSVLAIELYLRKRSAETIHY